MQAIQTAIALAHQQLLAAFRQGKAAGVAAIYALDGQIMPAYSTEISGRAAIQAFWQGCIDMGIYALQRRTLELDCLPETVNEVGEYRILDRQGRVVDLGNYVVIWKRQEGEWQIYRGIWTSSLPHSLVASIEKT